MVNKLTYAMVFIEKYEFGRILIDGRWYTTDVIIYPDRVREGWWRKHGHRLLPEDLEEVVEYKPEILVIGNGHDGVMEVPRETLKYIESKGIKPIVQRTGEACKTFNELIKSGKKAVAAFHLTC